MIDPVGCRRDQGEADLIAAIAQRRVTQASGWGDRLIVALVFAPWIAPAIALARLIRRLL